MTFKFCIKFLPTCQWNTRSTHRSNPQHGHAYGNSSEANQRLIFEMLPPDLIIYLAQFLPLSSKVLFALSCQTATAILGTYHRRILKATDQYKEHLAFLEQLSKDLPSDYVPCYHCRILHLCTLVSSSYVPTRPLYQWCLTPCYEAELESNTALYLHKDFRFQTFQMAMKQHRLGLDHTIWLQCLNLPSSYSTIFEKVPSKLTADVKIVNDSLLVRSKRIILIPPGQDMGELDRVGFAICPHIKLVARGTGINMPDIFECALNHEHDMQRCVRKSDMLCCMECWTEYELRLTECGERGVAVVVQKWKDLGEGRTVLDPKWLSQLEGGYVEADAAREVDCTERERQGTIREAFEREEPGECVKNSGSGALEIAKGSR